MHETLMGSEMERDAKSTLKWLESYDLNFEVPFKEFSVGRHKDVLGLVCIGGSISAIKDCGPQIRPPRIVHHNMLSTFPHPHLLLFLLSLELLQSPSILMQSVDLFPISTIRLTS